ncbi:hypothetical protein R1flu_013278 [Riccia fluitans]|uniref:Uncharacterized protein n=1 Tax=Riccia fluitans TaxID=41844 RepID=A0ABD1YCY2_9MARC
MARRFKPHCTATSSHTAWRLKPHYVACRTHPHRVMAQAAPHMRPHHAVAQTAQHGPTSGHICTDSSCIRATSGLHLDHI